MVGRAPQTVSQQLDAVRCLSADVQGTVTASTVLQLQAAGIAPSCTAPQTTQAVLTMVYNTVFAVISATDAPLPRRCRCDPSMDQGVAVTVHRAPRRARPAGAAPHKRRMCNNIHIRMTDEPCEGVPGAGRNNHGNLRVLGKRRGSCGRFVAAPTSDGKSQGTGARYTGLKGAPVRPTFVKTCSAVFGDGSIFRARFHAHAIPKRYINDT